MNAPRKLGERELRDIVNGACILGCGGGGPLSIGLQILEELLKQGKPVLLADPSSIDAAATMAVSADVGSPDAASGGGFDFGAAPIAYGVLDALQQHAGWKPFSYVLPGEVGAGNSFIPMSVAAQKGIPIVDAAGARRAIPGLAMCTYASHQIPISPIAMGNESNQVTLTVKDIPTAEAAIHGIISGDTFGQLAGVAFWPMNGKTMQGSAIFGTTSYAEKLGATLREALAAKKDPVEAVRAYLEGYLLFVGTIVDSGEQTSGGFDYGRVTLKADDGSELYIFNQNENLIAWNTKDARPVAMGPDLICYLTTDGLVFSNADMDIPKGKKVAVIGAKAPPQMRDPKIVVQFTNTLRQMAWYAGPYVPIEELNRR